jgi:hypothetical protein
VHVNEGFNKNIDVFDAKIKAAIATCERAAAEIRSNIPAMIDAAVASAQAMANIRHPTRQVGDREGSRRQLLAVVDERKQRRGTQPWPTRTAPAVE